jgi:DNA-binding NtrC family response regulator
MKELNKKVLVAEDEEGIRLLYSTLVERMGYTAVSAGNGEEAYQLYQTEHPDLLLTDANMPVIDGFGLIRQIRQEDVDLPVILVSGQWDRDESVQRELNFTYLSKPIDVARFIKLVEENLSAAVHSHA